MSYNALPCAQAQELVNLAADAELTAAESSQQHSTEPSGSDSLQATTRIVQQHAETSLQEHVHEVTSTASQGHRAGPDDQLSDIWHHLKQLETAVKLHLQSKLTPGRSFCTTFGIFRGCNDSMSATVEATDHPEATDGTSSSDSSAEPSPRPAADDCEREKLRKSLSKIKSEIAERAVKQVEALLLQQRVAYLEAALAGLTGSGMQGMLSTSCSCCTANGNEELLTCSPQKAPACIKHPTQGPAQLQQITPNDPRPINNPGVSQLFDRFSCMEAALRDLATAQATSSSVLSELAMSERRASARLPLFQSSPRGYGTSQERGSAHLPCRPPSCPLADGPLAYWKPGTSAGHTPCKSSVNSTQRPTSATVVSTVKPSLLGFSSVVANPVFSPQSPAQSPEPQASPGESASNDHHKQRPPSTTCPLPLLDSAAQARAQEHSHWHVDVVLASHDAELASVKDAVSHLEYVQQTASICAEETSLHLASLDHRLQVLEHGMSSARSASLVTLGHVPASEGSLQERNPTLEATLLRGIGCPECDTALQCEKTAPDVHAQDGVSGSLHAKESPAAGAEDVTAHTANHHPFEACTHDSCPELGAARQMEAALPANNLLIQNPHTTNDISAGSMTSPQTVPTVPQASYHDPPSHHDLTTVVQMLLSSTMLQDIIQAQVQKEVSMQLSVMQTTFATHAPEARGCHPLQLVSDGQQQGTGLALAQPMTASHTQAVSLQQDPDDHGGILDISSSGSVCNISTSVAQIEQQVGRPQGMPLQQPAQHGSDNSLLQPPLQEIELDSQSLAEAFTALKAEVERLHHQQMQLQQQLQDAIQSASDSTAAIGAATAAAAQAAADAQAQTQRQALDKQQLDEASAAVAHRLEAIEDSLLESKAMQASIARLEQNLCQQMEHHAEQLSNALAASVSAEQRPFAADLSEKNEKLASRLQVVEDMAAQLAANAEASAAAARDSAAQWMDSMQKHVAEIDAKVAAACISVDAKLAMQADSVDQRINEAQVAINAAVLDQVTAGNLKMEQHARDLEAVILNCNTTAALQHQLQAQTATFSSHLTEIQAAASTALGEHMAAVDSKLQQQAVEQQAAWTALDNEQKALHAKLYEFTSMLTEASQNLDTCRSAQAANTHDVYQQLQRLDQEHAAVNGAIKTDVDALRDVLQLAMQQLKEELACAVAPVSSGLKAVRDTLAQHANAIEASRGYEDAVEMLSTLPATCEGLSDRLQELSQAQRAAEGELSAGKEFSLVLDQQLATTIAQLQLLQEAVSNQQGHEEDRILQLRQGLLEPVVQELDRLQQHRQRLQQLQQEQGTAIEQLQCSLKTLTDGVLSKLTAENVHLEKAVEELQTVVSDQCVKMDQLGTIFSARDNMYGAWLKMQALFDSNRCRSSICSSGMWAPAPDRGPSTSLLQMRPGSTVDTTSAEHSMNAQSSAAANSGEAPQPGSFNKAAASTFDPFDELTTRLHSSAQHCRNAASEEEVQPARCTAASTTSTAAADDDGVSGVDAAAAVKVADVAAAQALLREEVGSLAIQLHAALADVKEQLAAINLLRGEQFPQQQQAQPEQGFLHAPLSLVVQLQQELAAAKAEAISKDQFAAVVRMVRELRQQEQVDAHSLAVCCTPGAGLPVSEAAEQAAAKCDLDSETGAAVMQLTTDPAHAGVGPQQNSHVTPLKIVAERQAAAEVRSASDTCSSEGTTSVLTISLQQQEQRLDDLEAMTARLQHQTAAAQAVVQQQAAQLSQLHCLVTELQQHGQQAALADSATALADICDKVLALQEVVHRQEDKWLAACATNQQDLEKLSRYVDDLASKVYTASNAAAAAAAVVRPHAAVALLEPSATGGFPEMVAGLASLKACLDRQAEVLAGMGIKVDEHGVMLQELQSTAAAAAAAAPVQPCECGTQVDCQNLTGCSARKDEAVESPTQLADVVVKVTTTEAGPGDVASQSCMASWCGEDDDGHQEDKAAARDLEVVYDAGTGDQPIGFLHSLLVELKRRIEKLEADGIEAKATAAAVAALTAAAEAAKAAAGSGLMAAACPAASVQKHTEKMASKQGVAWPVHARNAAACQEDLQELVVCLQSDVDRLDLQYASVAAKVESLRGDVGAAAAAAAATAAAIAGAAGQLPATASAGVDQPLVCGEEPAKAFDAGSCEHVHDVAAVANDVVMLWAAVDDIKEQLLNLQEAEATVKAVEWVSGSSNINSSSCSHGTGTQLTPAGKMQHTSEDLTCTASVAPEKSGTVLVARQSLGIEQSLMSPPPSVAQSGQQMTMDLDGCVPLQTQDDAAKSKLTQPDLRMLVATQVDKNAGFQRVQADVDNIKKQLLVLQQQLQHTNMCITSTSCGQPAGPGQPPADGTQVPAAATSRPVTFKNQQLEPQIVIDSVDDSTVALQRLLSFGDLARSSNGQPPARAPAGLAANSTTPPAALLVDSGSPLTEPAALELTGSSEPPTGSADPSNRKTLSRTLSSISGRSSARRDRVSVRHLLQEMSAMPAQKQISVVAKLASLVSSHATRLMATYHDDPELTAQLQQVQEQLSDAVKAATAGGQANSPGTTATTCTEPSGDSCTKPSGASLASAAAGVRSSTRRRTVGNVSVTAADCASLGSGGSGEALLLVLDQVASLRAIGSATHPAISETLRQHAAQLSEMKDSLEALSRAVGALAETSGPSLATSITSSHIEPASKPDAATGAAYKAVNVVECDPPAVSMECAAVQSCAPLSACAKDEQQPAASYDGELSHRLADVESRLAAGLKVLHALRSKLSPLQEVADATQSMIRELQVAQGVALQRVEALEGLAAAVASDDAEEDGDATNDDRQRVQQQNAISMAGTLRRLQEGMHAADRRLTAVEASVAHQLPECVATSRRLAARQADAETRSSTVTTKVATLVSGINPLLEVMSGLESRLDRSLTVARQGLDILADQLVALGALNRRTSPTKNPLAALGPHHAAITALEGKLEAIRTALTASVKLMIQELAAGLDATSSTKSASLLTPDMAAGIASLKALAAETAAATSAAHTEAMMQLELKLAELQREVQTQRKVSASLETAV